MQSDDNGNGQAGSEYSVVPEDVLTELDPDLQNVVLALRQGRPLPPHLVEDVTEDGEVISVIDVVAKLNDPDEKVPGLLVVQKIGQIVTGMVDAKRIEEVRGHPNVISLKAARRLHKTLSNSVPEINASQAQLRAALPAGHAPVDGSGVIVGFVDHGCDFSHPNFRKLDAEKGTRVLYLWDQRGGTTEDSPTDYGYGREFDAAAINSVLRNAQPGDGPDAPHRRLGYKIESEHGTHVMDVAIGNGGGKNPPGVAPGADIIFVEAALGDFEDEESFGNSRHLVEAVKYIFDKADKMGRPAVVNISLSYDAGPHDGSTPVEEALDHLLEKPGRAIVLAAGNSRALGRHLKRVMRPSQTRTLRWQIQANDLTSNKLEIWYGGRHRLRLLLRSPTGQELGPFALNTTFTICRKEEPAGHVFHRGNDSCNGDNHIVLSFGTLVEPGVWELELQPDSGKEMPFDVHAWIETDDGAASFFLDAQRSDDSYTIGTLACGHFTIVVGGYDTFTPHGVIKVSGEGPTRDGKLKPEVAAPGTRLNAAEALTDTVSSATGTSVAAPHVAGLIALLIQAAGKFMTIDQIRDLVINPIITSPARHGPPPVANAWDPRFGAGRVDATASVLAAVPAPMPAVVVIEHQELITSHAITDSTPCCGEVPQPNLTESVVAAMTFKGETLTVLATPLANAADPLLSDAGEPPGANVGEVSLNLPPPTKGH